MSVSQIHMHLPSFSGKLSNVSSYALDLHLMFCFISLDVHLTIWLLSGICMLCLVSLRQGSWLYFGCVPGNINFTVPILFIFVAGTQFYRYLTSS